MDGQRLQSLLAKGLGVTGRLLGTPYVVYRPKGPINPTSQRNRHIVLDAAFAAEGNGAPRAPDFGDALWQGKFDTNYTQPGDYLVGANGTFLLRGNGRDCRCSALSPTGW